MDSQAFADQVSQLKTALLTATSNFFLERGLVFDVLEFIDQTQVDLDTMAREAHFFGAGVFPDETAEIAVAA